jgi:hypothetical protein
VDEWLDTAFVDPSLDCSWIEEAAPTDLDEGDLSPHHHVSQRLVRDSQPVRGLPRVDQSRGRLDFQHWTFGVFPGALLDRSMTSVVHSLILAVATQSQNGGNPTGFGQLSEDWERDGLYAGESLPDWQNREQTRETTAAV